MISRTRLASSPRNFQWVKGQMIAQGESLGTRLMCLLKQAWEQQGPAFDCSMLWATSCTCFFSFLWSGEAYLARVTSGRLFAVVKKPTHQTLWCLTCVSWLPCKDPQMLKAGIVPRLFLLLRNNPTYNLWPAQRKLEGEVHMWNYCTEWGRVWERG